MTHSLVDTKCYNGTKYAYYPACCLSASCGKCGDECNNSCNKRIYLDAFNAWVTEHAAVCDDEIWSRTLYRATKDGAK